LQKPASKNRFGNEIEPVASFVFKLGFIVGLLKIISVESLYQ